MVDSALPAGSFKPTTRETGVHDEMDLLVQYTGIKSLTLSGSVRNLFDRLPPYSNTGAQNQYGSLGFPWIFSPRGRFMAVTANYKFY